MARRNAAVSPATPPGAIDRFDYSASAELFMTRAKVMRRPPISYRRFGNAAEAIQFAVEELPAAILIGAVMEVQEERFDHQAIRALYDREGYPLKRR
jgi:hypothetical protein